MGNAFNFLEDEIMKTPQEIKNIDLIYGNIHNNFILNWIRNNNLVAIKMAVYISKFNIGNNYTVSGDLIKLKVSLKEFCNFTNIPYQSIKDNMNDIGSARLSQVLVNNKFVSYPLIGKYTILKDDLEIDLYEDVFNLLKENKSNFTNINVENIMKCKNKHSIRMLLLLSYINNFDGPYQKSQTLTLEELNNFFGTKYKRFVNIKDELLKKIQDDLTDSKSFLNFKMIDIKDKESGVGRNPISGIKIVLNNSKKIHELKSEFKNIIKTNYVDKIIFKDGNKDISINSNGEFFNLANGEKLKDDNKIWDILFKDQYLIKL